MKKHYKFALALTILLGLFGAKSIQAQWNTIYYQSFDSTSNGLPPGWVATGNDPGGYTWTLDVSGTNASYGEDGTSGYAGASGLNNVAVVNADVTSTTVTDTLILTSSPISTYNYDSIEVAWGDRLTHHFEDEGSYVLGFYASTDDGVTWTNVPYTENIPQSGSPWYWANTVSNTTPADSVIPCPVSIDHQRSVKFRWIAELIYNASGTYRIDDFTVKGVYQQNTAVSNVSDAPSAYAFVSNNNTINVVSNDLTGEKLTVELFDLLGNSLKKEEMSSSKLALNASNLASGMYLVRISNSTAATTTKVEITR